MLIVAWLLVLVFSIVSVQAARDGDVRLVNSNRYGTGRVEVFYEGSWGTICGRGWDLNDAEVICRQLNFPNGALRSFYEAKFGEGGGKVLLSDVSCEGDENNLLECGNVQNNWGMNDCQHELDVGVQCSAPNYQGCLAINFLRAAEGFQSEDMTIETCFGLCAPRGYRYFWLHGGGSCDCGDNIGAATQVGNERCATDCPGNFDQRCGGRDLASLYQVEADLPFFASPGFPGRFISPDSASITRNFEPQGTSGYSFIRFHQFDLPSLANVSVSSNGRSEVFQGGIAVNEYWVAPASNPIEISFQLPGGEIDSEGFIIEFGEGSYCDTVTTVSNGRLSTAPVPYTVGTQITVTCFSGYIPYDETVFCQADGNFNRDIMCVPGPSTTARSTPQPPRSTKVSSTAPQSTPEPTQPPLTTQQFPPSPVIISVRQKEYTADEGEIITVRFTTNEPAKADIYIGVSTRDSSHESELGPLFNATILEGQSSGTLQIQILEDLNFEGMQTIMVSFVSLTNGASISSEDETIRISITDTTPERNCTVPIIENGEHDSDTDTLSPGDILMVTCGFPYKADESIVTCQRDGTFTASTDCSLDVIIIVVIGVSALVVILIVALLVTLICCLCYYRQKRRRRVSSYERRNEQIDISGPRGGPPPISGNDLDDEEIIALPDGDGPSGYSESDLAPSPYSLSPVHSPPTDPPPPPVTPPVDPSDNPPAASEATHPPSTESGPTAIEANGVLSNNNPSSTEPTAQQAASQSVDNVVNDTDQGHLYGKINRPTATTSGGFGGHFSKV